MALGDSQAPGQAFQEFSSGILAGRPGTADDVTGTAPYLASEDDSDYMTGQIVMIDGGMVQEWSDPGGAGSTGRQRQGQRACIGSVAQITSDVRSSSH